MDDLVNKVVESCEKEDEGISSNDATALDICHAHKRSLTDFEKWLLIRDRRPSKTFVFPPTRIKDQRLTSGFTNRYCKHSYFKTFST